MPQLDELARMTAEDENLLAIFWCKDHDGSTRPSTNRPTRSPVRSCWKRSTRVASSRPGSLWKVFARANPNSTEQPRKGASHDRTVRLRA